MTAVAGQFLRQAFLEADIFAFFGGIFFHLPALFQTQSKGSFQGLTQLSVCDRYGGCCQIPRDLRHWNNRFESYAFVIFVSLEGLYILVVNQWTNIPCYIIAPT